MNARRWVVAHSIALVFALHAQFAQSSGMREQLQAPPLATAANPSASAFQLAGAGSGVCGLPDFAAQVVELTNIQRFESGRLPPLKQVDSLDAAAQDHSYNMAHRNFFAHCDPDTKKTPWARMRDAGYDWDWAGENAATGYATPEQAVAGLMDSPGHRAIILGAYREIGVGYHYYSGDSPDTRTDANNDCTPDGELGYSTYRYWTQNFGARNGIFPVVINLEAHSTQTRSVALYLHGAGWAGEMRIRNDDGPWTPWRPFASETVWQLGQGNGTHTVHVETRSAAGTVKYASDDICLDAVEVPPAGDMLFGHGFE